MQICIYICVYDRISPLLFNSLFFLKSIMSTTNYKPFDVAIIGGGISGLSTAWYLQTASVSYTVLESAERWGGKVLTDYLTSPEGEPFIIDAGPESFITRKPEAWELAHELGLQDRIVGVGNEASGTYILDEGRVLPVPLGPVSFIRSPLMSARGKLRLLAEPFIPARRDYEDESLADFASRRLGHEAMEKFIAPILAGIYNTNPEQQSIMTTSPVMREMEREHGGLFKGSFARMNARRQAAKNGHVRPPSFIAFRQGAQELVDKLVEQLTGDLQLKAQVTAITRIDDHYRLALSDGREVQARTLILATQANAAAKLLRDTAPQAADLLARIRHNHIGTISLAFRERDIQGVNRVRGLMIPRREGRMIDAITWTSEKMDGRAPDGYTLLRVFFGGGAPETTSMDSESLLAVVRGELKKIIGLDAEPIAISTFSWPDEYPQADVGHLALVDSIEKALPENIFVTGSPYRGLGVPDCIRQGKQTALETITLLNARA